MSFGQVKMYQQNYVIVSYVVLKKERRLVYHPGNKTNDLYMFEVR